MEGASTCLWLETQRQEEAGWEPQGLWEAASSEQTGFRGQQQLSLVPLWGWLLLPRD